MDPKKIKNDVLQDLIDLMDMKNLEGLKSKSPKFMKLEVEATSPEQSAEKDTRAQELEDMRRLKEMKGNVQDKHMDMLDPMGGFKDPFKRSHMDENKLLDDSEDLERLMEMYKNLK